MKKILSLLTIALLATLAGYSQTPAPGIFNYQGVARNSVGNVLINQSIMLRLTIHDLTPGGAVVYQESRGVTTNPFGLFNAQVGSAGAINVTGTIAGVPWGVGNKYIQVEIDPAGGSSFINIGTAQIASVPYALYSSSSNDLVLPFNKTQANAGTLFTITNSGTSISGAIMGVTQSPAANAWGVHGRVDNTAAGGFSAGVLGTNLSLTGNGIGVMGTQNGGGWGVYGTAPSGIGVNGLSTSGTGVSGASTSGTGVFGTSSTGVSGIFTNTNAANTSDALQASTNGTGTSWALRSTSTGLQGAGIFTYNNAAGAANTIRSTNNGSGAGISVTATGTGSAGLFSNTNAANAAVTVSVASNSTTGVGILSTMSGTGQVSAVSGFISTTTGGSAGVNGADFSSGGASGIEARTYAVLGQTGTTGIAVGGYASAGGTALRGSGGGVTGFALSTTGNVRHTGIGEAANRILATVSGTGDASWVDPSAVGVVTGTGVATRVAFWNSVSSLSSNANLYWDNVSSRLGIGTAVPTQALHVAGTVRIVDGTQANNFILRSDAIGNANWVDPAILLPGANFWTRVGTNLWNTNLGDNVGVGTNTPAYRLDVQHGGATGLHVVSTASFSVVDIDANTGDAALRFQKAGVGQWNTRNRPADNYYEIFELGGGGSRMVIQDATGNVGIGGAATVSPAYRLDVEHGGATGIRSKSATGSGSFSVIDIDADNGDAALRFQKAGAGQWNTRNRPADDYYEIFELGGGGSRVVIQDGTGNVGIGATVAPAYRLDVEHGGATGIRSKSTASFSVIDIDAASGDAALRFAFAGVNQWNMRNRPGDNYLEIFELGGGGSRMAIQDGTGNVGIGTTGAGIAYRLDVQHGGATGIRSQSTASFSVVDIDAASGDAALRFANAGVNQWNIRNRPGDDYLEIFELGGGGSRMAIQDATGNVGIGTTGAGIAYRLDVQHGGATGLRVQSTATFSIIDIDGANGDAALRFANAGVNQWNTRNNPATNDYQIFELGGGGERIQIQDGSGNVGIGGVSPAYRLDVLHGGATGIRSRSSATFSVIDIDGNNGDAALRFQRAGVNQWNIRNNPANDDLQFFELGGGGERMRIENTTGRVWVDGDLHVDGTLSKTAGAFKIDHPLDPENKYLWHSFVESPDMMNIYNGNIVTDASGKATVQLPDYFQALNMEFRYQLTVIGAFAQAIISKEVSNNKFEIATNQPSVKVSWQVTGIRHDAYAEKHRIPNVVEKDAKDKGKYLNPEAFDQPKSKGIGYTQEDKVSSLNDVKPVQNKAVDPASISGGSLDYTAPKVTTNKPADNSGSVAPQTEVKKAEVKPTDNSGSVAPQTEVKKAEVKPVEVKGTSTEDVPKKAVEEKKKPSAVPESTKTD